MSYTRNLQEILDVTVTLARVLIKIRQLHSPISCSIVYYILYTTKCKLRVLPRNNMCPGLKWCDRLTTLSSCVSSVKYEDPGAVEGLAGALDTRLQVTGGVSTHVTHTHTLTDFLSHTTVWTCDLTFFLILQTNSFHNDVDKWLSCDTVRHTTIQIESSVAVVFNLLCVRNRRSSRQCVRVWPVKVCNIISPLNLYSRWRLSLTLTQGVVSHIYTITVKHLTLFFRVWSVLGGPGQGSRPEQPGASPHTAHHVQTLTTVNTTTGWIARPALFSLSVDTSSRNVWKFQPECRHAVDR